MNVFGALLALLVVAKIAKANAAEQPLTIAVGEQNGSAPPDQNLPWFLVYQPGETVQSTLPPGVNVAAPVPPTPDENVAAPVPPTPDENGTPPLINDTREAGETVAAPSAPVAPDQDIYNQNDPFFSANPDRYYWSGSQWMRKGW